MVPAEQVDGRMRVPPPPTGRLTDALPVATASRTTMRPSSRSDADRAGARRSDLERGTLAVRERVLAKDDRILKVQSGMVGSLAASRPWSVPLDHKALRYTFSVLGVPR